MRYRDGKNEIKNVVIRQAKNYRFATFWIITGGGVSNNNVQTPTFVFPNYQDYGYGIFLLDEKSRDYVLKNIGAEKDDFLRSMMWGTLWDSVREAELNPKDYVELAIKNISVEQDESTIQAILGRVGTALNYYLPDAQRDALMPRLEAVLTERIANAKTPGQRITFYRVYQSLASSVQAQKNLKDILAGKSKLAVFQLRTKDKFDIVTRLLILGDREAPALLANFEKTETSDDAKRYAYAARAGIGTADAKAKYFRDFMTNKEISESWIEAAFVPFNSARHSDLTLPYLETALAELPNLKRTRKIFFVNGWLGAFLGGQKSEEALATVNKFLADNPNLDKDMRLKILENADNLERAVKIRGKYGK
jgi:aminopeptidase N